MLTPRGCGRSCFSNQYSTRGEYEKVLTVSLDSNVMKPELKSPTGSDISPTGFKETDCKVKGPRPGS